MRTLALSCLAIALLLVGSAPAAAEPTREELRRAKQHYKQGKALQEAGKYDEAVLEYQTAYDLTYAPELLFNLGQVYRLQGNKPKALELYRKYLEASPEGPGSEHAKAFVQELTVAIRAEEEAAARKRAAEEAEQRRRAEAEAAAQRRAKAEAARREAERAAQQRAEEESATRRRWLRIGGYAAGGTGVALVGVGVGFAVRSSTLSARQGTQDRFDPGLIRSGRAANRYAWIFSGVGIGAIAGGGVLWWLAREPAAASSDDRLTIAPIVGPDLAGFAIADRF